MRDDKNSGQRSFSSPRSHTGSGQGGQNNSGQQGGQQEGTRTGGYSSRPAGQGGGSNSSDKPYTPRPAGQGGGDKSYTPRPVGASGGDRPYTPRPAGASGGDRPYTPRPAGANNAPRPSSPRPSGASHLQRPHDGPRINEMITIREVFLIDQDGNKIGATPAREAIAMATAVGLDLVEIVPNAEPPVCKIMDYGKYKYQEQKKAAEARKKQNIVEIKEIKVRPNIDDNDYQVKMRAILRLFEEGNKVKITLRFRGRELSHVDIGMKVLERIQEDIKDIGKIEQSPRVEGRQAVMVASPLGMK